MREAPGCRTATDTDSHAFSISIPNRQRGDDRGTEKTYMLKAAFLVTTKNNSLVPYEKILSIYNLFHINGEPDAFVLIRKICKDGRLPTIIVRGKDDIRVLSEEESGYWMAASGHSDQGLSPITAEHIPQDIQTPLCEYLVNVLGEDGTPS